MGVNLNGYGVCVTGCVAFVRETPEPASGHLRRVRFTAHDPRLTDPIPSLTLFICDRTPVATPRRSRFIQSDQRLVTDARHESGGLSYQRRTHTRAPGAEEMHAHTRNVRISGRRAAAQPEATRSNQKQPEAIKSNHKQSKAIRSNQKQPEATRSNQKQSKATRSNQKQPEATRSIPQW